MNVAIKHNGTAITGHVISYTREHKICTGIGSLRIEIDQTVPRTFVPWDEIDIYENGSFQVRYYVSSIEHNNPRASFVLDCQDKSKRLVDYFIPDSYTIDYPSYTRYWIEKFLTEAGITYQFTTTSQGTILSNYTNLGLLTAYEQIQTLLQMSGWYMYFDGNGKAIIGRLDVDFAKQNVSVGKTDILDIMVSSNDKMLRNKALVFGSYDGYTNERAKASVSVKTPWNYDARDVRTVVISNSNIKDSGTAYNMANQIVKEFARITVEKYITLWGARNFDLGAAMRVTSNVWKGRGLVTTFGVEMSKQGLITRVVLDERCPRLFGYFDFGDYVYVATFGDGVWRKHIKYDPTWYNFSTGLTNLNITDLHINNGVFASVGHSGQMYYTIDSLPWKPITMPTSLMSSIEDNVTTVSGETVPMQAFSGLFARAVIVDKLGNTVKFAIDNFSGINTGDYFIDASGIMGSGIVSSGVAGSGHLRSWIMEYDVLAGDVTGTSYPISLSGNYGYSVLDIENDGRSDYVSVATSGQTLPHTALGYNLGSKRNVPQHDTYDPNNIVAYNLMDDFDQSGETLKGTASATGTTAFAVFNDESSGERKLVWIQSVSGTVTMKELSISKVAGVLTSSTKTSPTISPGFAYPYIVKGTAGVYKFYRISTDTPSAGKYRKYSYRMRTWDTVANTLTSEVTLATTEIDDDTTKNSFNKVDDNHDSMINGVIYRMYVFLGIGYASSSTNYVKTRLFYLDTSSDSASTLDSRIDFEDYVDYTSNWQIFSLEGSFPMNRWGFQNGNFPAYALFIRERNITALPGDPEWRAWLLHSPYGGTFTQTLIEELTDLPTGSIERGGAQLTNDRYIKYIRYSDGRTYFFNGISIDVVSSASVPFQWNPSNITPMFGAFDTNYVAKNGSQYYWCEPVNCAVGSEITFPANYSPVKIFSTSSNYNQLYYWQALNNDTTQNEILRYSSTGYYGNSIKPSGGFTFSQNKGIIAGNFFLDFNGGLDLRWLYVDNPNPAVDDTIYQVLRKNEDATFTLIEQETYPIRLDISNNSPVLTVGSGESTFTSNLVYETELVVIEAAPSGVVGSGRQVEDYRYTFLQPTIGEVSSGTGISSTILYTNGSGIYAADALTYSGGFSIMFSIPSGSAKKIETSNYGAGGQYVFITTSGYVQSFYQKDPDQFSFVEYSGIPQSRATIIRLDDAV